MKNFYKCKSNLQTRLADDTNRLRKKYKYLFIETRIFTPKKVLVDKHRIVVGLSIEACLKTMIWYLQKNQ